jgi:1-phosphatidylinositol-4-phosphate 5-kinase
MLNKFSRESVTLRKDLTYNYNIEIRKPFFEKDRGGLQSLDGKKIYFIGIIDIFTNYGTKKKAENLFKSVFQGPDISCKPPIEYYERFFNFMKKIFDETSI